MVTLVFFFFQLLQSELNCFPKAYISVVFFLIDVSMDSEICVVETGGSSISHHKSLFSHDAK